MESRIRAARIRANISVAELARLCGVTRQSAASWDQGASNPRPDMLRKIANHLGTSVDQLVVRSGLSADTAPAGPLVDDAGIAAILNRCRHDIAAVTGMDYEAVGVTVTLTSTVEHRIKVG